ncbi:hypothetical protein BSL82_11715 [Tardibacter chloracetimidivorans]|uniref:Amidohydrolase 3 domain-containing protein n=1 Tax=Tardibacter chloracetimidivorans TaxID=1921510 RepID=A0A1L3ZW84_9SPHN|nr:amidohydrolase family protein [Tardibacter chloracetimidivorans]API59894.1 hypothetical protein BSL82_11715 [Tardibacter chloracetimidivorans]
MGEGSLIIENARIIDGSGAPAFAGAVRIEGNRIVAVARAGDALDVAAAAVIDAGGLVLSPGFIDAHTHYDAQVIWDKMIDPVALHGATTVVTGSCSFTLAPADARTIDVIHSLFLKAEDLRLANYADVVDFKWSSFEDYLDRIRGGLGVNVAPLFGHTPLRHHVMGADAQKRAATADELAQMCELLRGALRAGAVGLSMSFLDTDENNVPIGSRWADEEERTALARVLVEEGRGVLQSNLRFGPGSDPNGELEQLGRISKATGVHVEALGAFAASAEDPVYRSMLATTERLQSEGADIVLQTTSKPFDQFLQFNANFFVFFLLPHWQDVMNLSVPERIAYFSDHSKRPALRASLELEGHLDRFMKSEVLEAQTPSVRALEGRLVADIAAERGADFLDTLLDIALEDELRTVFALRGFAHTDPDCLTQILTHPHTRPASGSDGGAHFYQFSTSGDSTTLLARWVRERGIMSLEEAVRKLTSVPAAEFNIRDRGVIRPGNYADLVLFDPDVIDNNPTERRFDLPDGSGRYLNTAKGVAMVFVNGRKVVENGAYTDERPGLIV